MLQYFSLGLKGIHIKEKSDKSDQASDKHILLDAAGLNLAEPMAEVIRGKTDEITEAVNDGFVNGIAEEAAQPKRESGNEVERAVDDGAIKE